MTLDEKEWKERIGDCDDSCADCSATKSFVRELLSRQRTELKERIEREVGEKERYSKGDFLEHRDEYNTGFNTAREEVLRILSEGDKQ